MVVLVVWGGGVGGVCGGVSGGVGGGVGWWCWWWCWWCGVVVLVVVVVNKTGWDSLMLVQSPRAIKPGKAPLHGVNWD